MKQTNQRPAQPIEPTNQPTNRQEYLLSYKPALSVLFNAFILAQVRCDACCDGTLGKPLALPAAGGVRKRLGLLACVWCCQCDPEHGAPTHTQCFTRPPGPPAPNHALIHTHIPPCGSLHLQVANAFVSRRIGLELNFFKGLAHSPIFNGIMVLITALQVLIMQTPISYIFKVEPLNGPEWGACIAIGIGAIPFSW